MQIVIVASLVIVIDQILQAYFAEISRALSVYRQPDHHQLPRARPHREPSRATNPPLPSMVDAFGNGLGYSLVLIVIGGLRELFGRGAAVRRAGPAHWPSRAAGSRR